MLGYGLLVVLILLVLWRGGDVVAQLLFPYALIPPVVEFGARTLGWPAWLPSSRVAIFVLVGIRLFQYVMSHKLPLIEFSPITRRPALTYALLATLSVLVCIFGEGAPDPLAVIEEYGEWLISISVFFIVASTRHSDREFDTLATLIGLVTGGIVVFSLFQAAAIGGVDVTIPSGIENLVAIGRREFWFGSFRVYGTLPNLGPNFFGVALILPALLMLSRMLSIQGVARALWGIALTGTVVIVGLTYSRGAQLGLVVGAASLFLVRRRYVGFAIFCLTIALAGVVLSEVSVVQNASSLVTSGQLDPDAEARLNVWRTIVREMPRHPIGFGFDGWLRASAHVIETAGDPRVPVGGEHAADNMWMRELADRGVLGVVALGALMTGLIITFFRAVNRRDGDASAAMDWARCGFAGAIGLSAAMLTGDHLMYVNLSATLWLFFGLAQSAAGEIDRAAPVFR